MARYEKTGQVKSTTRTDRPKITTVRDDGQLLISSRHNREISYEQLRQEFAVYDVNLRFIGVHLPCLESLLINTLHIYYASLQSRYIMIMYYKR